MASNLRDSSGRFSETVFPDGPRSLRAKTCKIQWIGCDGVPTPDDNPAIGFAVFHAQDGTKTRYPICAEHHRSIGDIHHGQTGGKGLCHHSAKNPDYPRWTFEPFEAQS